jgi:hypothetical protein
MHGRPPGFSKGIGLPHAPSRKARYSDFICAPVWKRRGVRNRLASINLLFATARILA